MDTSVGFSSSFQNGASPSKSSEFPDRCLAPRRPAIKKRINRELVETKTPPRRFTTSDRVTWAPKRTANCSIRRTPEKRPALDSESLLLAPRARRTPKSIKSTVQKRFEKITWAPRKTYKRTRHFSK